MYKATAVSPPGGISSATSKKLLPPIDFTATVNSEVLSSVSFPCHTQNGKQNNLLQPVSLQSLFSHATDTSYFLFPEVHNISNLLAFTEKNKKSQEV